MVCTGFTLIEVLVVLVMAALVSSILFQALERAYRLQSRFGSELFKVQQGQMAEDWYRQSVAGLYPDRADGADLFRGKAKDFAGLSSTPLSESYGAPTPISWKIQAGSDGDTRELVYVEDKKQTLVLVWKSKQASFVYIDSEKAPHNTWPPPLGLFPQLPTQIQIVTSNLGEPIQLVATPMGPTSPALRPQDFFGGKL